MSPSSQSEANALTTDTVLRGKQDYEPSVPRRVRRPEYCPLNGLVRFSQKVARFLPSTSVPPLVTIKLIGEGFSGYHLEHVP